MEEIYMNVKPVNKRVNPRPSTNQTAPRSSERRFHGAVVLCLGLLSVFLLAGLIGHGIHHYNSIQRSAAEFSAITANLTEERDLLNASLAEMTKELDRLRRPCTAGWRMFSGACYFLSCESGSWTTGREDCRDKGADLVVIDSTEEKKFLSNFTEKETMAWIGLTDEVEEGSWMWVDGSPLSQQLSKNWRKGQPDNGGGYQTLGQEDCAHIITGGDENNLNDLSCSTSLRWICEEKWFRIGA